VNVRFASTEALGKIGEDGAVIALKETLRDEPWVAMASVKALGDIGGDDAREILYGCLERDEYRGIAFEALEKAGDEHTIEYLIPSFGSDDLGVLALKAAASIADRKGIPLPPECLTSLIPLLIDLQQSPDRELRRIAFIALAWAGDRRGLPYFIDALTDYELQEYAINGIIGIGDGARKAVVDALEDTGRSERDVLAKILSMMGEYTSLLEFSEDDDPEVRVEVALAVGRVNTSRNIEILERMLNDPEDEVRLAARKSSLDLEL